MVNNDDLKYIQILWDFMKMNQKIEKSDCMIVLGCADLKVVNTAIDLYKKGLADTVIFTGGYGKITKNIWNIPEANKFAEIAVNNGVPKNKIYIENKSTNTIENFEFTKKLIEREKLKLNSVIFVCRPQVEKRTWACYKRYMQEYKAYIASENTSCKEYMESYNIPNVPKDAWINVLVGDIQRMKVYAERHLQAPVDIPNNVWNAYEELIKRGYNNDLLG